MNWLWSPIGMLLVLPAPVLIGSLSLSDETFLEMFGHPVFLTSQLKEIAALYFLLIATVAAIAVPSSTTALASVRLDAHQQAWLDRSVRALTLVTVSSYGVWFAAAASRGLRFTSILALLESAPDAMYELRTEYLSTIGGVTTWMQVGALAVPLAILRSRAGIRRARSIVSTLLLFSLLRALLNSERLAVIEILISALLALLMLRPAVPVLLRRKIVVATLVAGSWVALLLTFGAFEYFRSWSNYRASGGTGFWVYVSRLLLGYYATALNNAAFDITLLNGRSAPGILFDGNFYTWIFGASPIARAQYDYGLTIYTNRSGLLGPSAAFGFLGGGVVLLAMAVLVSVLARRTRAGSPVALAMYCGSAVGLLEVVRLFYFGTSRFLPVLLAGIVLAITWRLASRKRAHDVQGHASATSLIAMTGVERS